MGLHFFWGSGGEAPGKIFVILGAKNQIVKHYHETKMHTLHVFQFFFKNDFEGQGTELRKMAVTGENRRIEPKTYMKLVDSSKGQKFSFVELPLFPTHLTPPVLILGVSRTPIFGLKTWFLLLKLQKLSRGLRPRTPAKKS